MDNKKQTFSDKLKVIAWAYKTAWNIDKKPIIIWYSISVLLAVLPSIALIFNKRTLTILMGFLEGQNYALTDAIRPIIFLGLFMVLIGLSARVNSKLVYMMMYETYYCGTQELLMDTIHAVPMTDLLKKDINDAYNFSLLRAGSLTDLISGACSIISKVVSIVSLLIVSFSMSTFIFTVSTVYVIAILVLNFKFTGKTRENISQNFSKSRLADYYEKLYDNKGIAKEIRMYENTEQIIQSWKEPFTEFQNIERNRAFASELRDFVSGTGFYIFLIVVLGKSLFDVVNHIVSPDIFLLLFTLCNNIYNAISGTARNIMEFDSGLIALEIQYRLFMLIEKQKSEEIVGTETTTIDDNTAFDVRNLTFSYIDGVPVLKNISFTIQRGEVVALVGQNGSGKTTLVKLLLDMYRTANGTIKLYGRPLQDYSRRFIREHISAFFQNFYIFHQTLRENVAVGSIEDIGDECKILSALEKGGGAKLIGKLSLGLNTLLGKFMDKSGTELSGGERQRVGVSRTHMSDRDILIFDEPASMVDPIAEAEQFQNIKKMLDDRTAVLISHRVGFARMADKIIILDNGEIAEIGTHDELIQLNGKYAHFFNEQAQWYSKANEVMQ